MKRSVLALAIAAALVVAVDRLSLDAGAAATPAELDALLAPVALYPDQLLAQMLLCSANPGKVAALNEWIKSHPTLKGTELQDAASTSGFEDSYVALALFPTVVEYMAVQADWTAKLGRAFAADKTAVFASVQRLRAKAKAAGTLKTTPQQQVETKTTSSGEQVIVIEPANPQVVYVPQYNPQVVYTQPATTTVVKESSSSSADAALAGVIGFTAGIAIGAAINNNYYYGPYGWHGGAYMYNDAWDDWADHREDAREDWQDHREDMYDERSDRAKDAQDTRTDRQQNAQQARTDQQASGKTRDAAQSRTTSTATQQTSRDTGTAARERSGTKSDAFSGYSSGKSERAASQRGQKSRSSSRSGGGSRRR